MPSELIYIHNGKRSTWHHYSKSTRGKSAKLRFLRNNGEWAAVRKTTITKVEEALKLQGDIREPADPIPISHSEYWRQTLLEKNSEMRSESVETEEEQETRLLAKFKRDLTKARSRVGIHETADLAAVIKRWSASLSRTIKDKVCEINKYDHTDATDSARIDTGKGWQSYLLEACRHDSAAQLPRTRRNFIECYRASEISKREVFFAAQEVNLAVPKARNLIVGDREGRINPDGLGVDRDGGLVVFEIKGPKDNLDPLCAVTQGILGAIAVNAKRKNLISLLKDPSHPESRRPSCEVKLQRICVYVLISTAHEGRRAPAVTKEYQRLITPLIKACDCIAEVSLFRVNNDIRNRFTARELRKKRDQPWLPVLRASNSWIRSDKGEVTAWPER